MYLVRGPWMWPNKMAKPEGWQTYRFENFYDARIVIIFSLKPAALLQHLMITVVHRSSRGYVRYVQKRDWFQSLQWRHNERDGVSNHQPHDCLLNRLFKARRLKKTSKLRVTGLCEGNSPVDGEFPTQRASNAENVSVLWRHHVVDTMFSLARLGRLYCLICWTLGDLKEL